VNCWKTKEEKKRRNKHAIEILKKDRATGGRKEIRKRQRNKPTDRGRMQEKERLNKW